MASCLVSLKLVVDDKTRETMSSTVGSEIGMAQKMRLRV